MKKKRLILILIIPMGLLIPWGFATYLVGRTRYPDLIARMQPIYLGTGTANDSIDVCWRSNSQALVSVYTDGKTTSIRYLNLEIGRDGKAREQPLPEPAATLLHSGNMPPAISANGNYFVVCNLKGDTRTFTEYDMAGKQLCQTVGRDADMAELYIAPNGPLWIEAIVGQSGRPQEYSYRVHQPGKADINVRSTESGFPEGINSRGEVVIFETAYLAARLDCLTYRSLTHEGETRRVELKLPNRVMVRQIVFSPINDDVLLLGTIPRENVFKLPTLRKIGFLARMKTPEQTVLFRMKQDGSGLTALGGVPMQYAGSISASWMPDGKRFSICSGTQIFVGNAF